MTIPENRPTDPWPCDLAGCAADLPAGYNPAGVVAVATEIMWALSGRRYGTVETLVRPCRADCGSYPATWWHTGAHGYVVPFSHFHDGAPTDTGSCSCTYLSEVALPGPVARIVEVKVDGVVLVDGTDYRVDSWRQLVRLGTQNRWPPCQDMLLADTEAGTWSVRYLRGRPVPEGGIRAVSRLACELAKAEVGADCDLPRNVVSVARQGVTVQVMDPQKLLSNGKTGLAEVDLWLQAVNPSALRARAKVFRADALRPRHSGT